MFAEAMSPGHADFARRVARITSGADSSKRTLFVGMDESYVLPARQSGRAAPLRRSGRGPRGVVPLLLALMTGVLAQGAVLVARVRFVDSAALPDDAMTATAALAGAALALALTVALALRLTSGPQLLVACLGVAAGVAMMHDLVHLWPEQSAALLTRQGVAEILATTAPRTIRIGATVFAF